MTTEADLAVTDTVTAEMVDCAAPEPAPAPTLPPPPANPVQRAAEATIGQTGADPPPEVIHG